MENLSTFVRTLGNQFIRGRKIFIGSIGLDGKVLDGGNSSGTTGQVLSTTGSAVEWITVGSSNVGEINDLSDVVISTATNGDLLQFNGTNWVNWAPNFLTTSAELSDLNDVGNLNPSNNDILVYNSGSGLWVADSYPTFTEADTLDTVTGRGSITTNNISVGDITSTNITVPQLDYNGKVTIASTHQLQQGESPYTFIAFNFGSTDVVTIDEGGYVTGAGFKVSGSSGFLKADGTVDTSTYLTSYTESQTLDSVTDLGATTINTITVGGVVSSEYSSTSDIEITAYNAGGLTPQAGATVDLISFVWNTTTLGVIDTDSNITFNGFKTPSGTSAGFLKADGSVDTTSYLSSAPQRDLDSLSDVSISNPQDEDILVYDNLTGEWINTAPTTTGASSNVLIACKNTSGSTINKGTPVYKTGTVGATNVIEIAPAEAGDAAKMPAVGLLTGDLVQNGTGYVIVTGELLHLITSPIDGSTPSINDTIYVKSSGGLTLTKPQGSTNLIQNMGLVGKVSNGNSGSLTVSSIMRSNDVPNLPTGKVWVGTATNTTASSFIHLDEANNRLGVNTLLPSKTLEVDGDVLVSGALTIEQNGDALNLRSTTNAVKPRITFSSDVPDAQIGHIEYSHSDGASYGSGESFVIGGTEASITILADGKLMYNEGIYSKPATGTGAGTRKDSNWDTAYSWGDHSGLYAPVSHVHSQYATLASPTFTGTPLAPTAASTTNNTQIATTAFVTTAVSNLVDAAPGALDTLGELAAALGDDANFSTTITNSIATKLPLAGGTLTGGLIGTTASFSRLITGENPSSVQLDLRRGSSGTNGNTSISFTQPAGVGYVGVDLNGAFSYGIAADLASSKFKVDRSGNATFAGTVSASNFSGSSSGTNTGDQTLPTDFVSAAGGGTFVGDVTFEGSIEVQGTITESSSIRFKENIKPLEPSLDKVEQLNPVTYNKIGIDEEEIGLIAEEVSALFPEVVTYNEEGQSTGIQYQRLSVILLKAMQELTNRVKKLEKK